MKYRVEVNDDGHPEIVGEYEGTGKEVRVTVSGGYIEVTREKDGETTFASCHHDTFVDAPRKGEYKTIVDIPGGE